MDYYSALGVPRNASQKEIKQAYRKLANKHHPDKGGDANHFQKISEAYDTLSDPHKKQLYDHGHNPNQQHYRRGPFEFHFGDPGMDDMFQNFGFGFNNRQARNKSFNVAVQVSLEDVLKGKNIAAEVSDGSGKTRLVNIQIPPGIASGQQIRYEGMGESSIPNIPAGDLIVVIDVVRHRRFERKGNDIITNAKVNVWDALLGGKAKIETLDGRSLNINVPKGSQPNTLLSCKGEGLPDINSKKRGNLLIKLVIEIPNNLSAKQEQLLKQIKNEV